MLLLGWFIFPPLLGYKNFPGINICLEKSLQDAKTLEQGGVDALMVENNYDIPHKVFVESEIVACMTFLTKEIINSVSIPIGVSVLWNDYKAALSIAKVCGGKFIRVPVFIDSVETQYGKVLAEPEKLLLFRKKLALKILLYLLIFMLNTQKCLNKSLFSSQPKKQLRKAHMV